MLNRSSSNSGCRIDCHQHFWQLDRSDYRWLTPELSVLYRDFLPVDLAPELQKADVSQTILVQATDTDAETDFMLSLAQQTDFIAGVVGWVDMESPDATHNIQALAKNPYFKGIRPMIQDIADPDWMLKPCLTPAFRALIECDLSFDALVLPQHLNNLLELLQRHPDLRTVIDHAAKPRISNGEIEDWHKDMQKLVSFTHAYCKFSGLVTEAGDQLSALQLQPYVDCLLDSFGPNRLMWGSDWPVVNLAMDYQAWASMSDELLQQLNKYEQQKIFELTARHFYQID